MDQTPGVKPEDFPATGTLPSGQSRRVLNLVCQILCASLVTVFFVIRCITKRMNRQPLTLEDVTCAVAWALIIVYVATVFQLSRYGAGYHIWELNAQQYTAWLKWLYIGTVVYCPAAYFTKTTLLLLIARLFSVRRTVARGIYGFLLGILICYIPIQVAKMAVCVPISAFWERNIPGAFCLNQNTLFLCDLTLAIITDAFILLLPIPLTWSLRISGWRKFKISMALGLGGVATAAVSFRMYWIVSTLHTRDVTYDFVFQDLFVMIELMIGEVCACLPSATILFKKYWSSVKLTILSCYTASTTSFRGDLRRYIPRPGTTILASTISGGPTQMSSVVEPSRVPRAYHAGESRAVSEASEDSHHYAAAETGRESAPPPQSAVSGEALVRRPLLNMIPMHRTTEILVQVSHDISEGYRTPPEYQENAEGVC